jgi:hypothetical protein
MPILAFDLSGETIAIIMSALERLKAAERINLDLGPGSESLIHDIERAEAELREQLPGVLRAAAREQAP